MTLYSIIAIITSYYNNTRKLSRTVLQYMPTAGFDIFLFPLSCILTIILQRKYDHDKSSTSACTGVGSAYSDLIGNTPLVELKRLSAILGRKVLAKMESLNPGTAHNFFPFPVDQNVGTVNKFYLRRFRRHRQGPCSESDDRRSTSSCSGK